MASAASKDFLAEDNLCGHTLLRLCARGNAIVAELQRLASKLPRVFVDPASSQSAQYAQVLFDFRYMKTPEMYETRIAKNLDLVDLDDEFQESHMAIMDRFYTLFNNIYMYYEDYMKFLRDVNKGFYISHTIEGVLSDTDGKQLMCEALYLWGVMLLLLDMRVPGVARERLIVAYFRYKGEGSVQNVDEVRKLCGQTGYVHGAAKPSGYPHQFFERFPVPPVVVSMVLDRLRSEDVYHQKLVYPAPEHRSAALAQQASLVYVILLFSPQAMASNKTMMREIVDKHFGDNWIVPLYMGSIVDLSVEWAPYKAARDALNMDTLTNDNLKLLLSRHQAAFDVCEKKLAQYLTEGVLLDKYIVDNVADLLHCLRQCNVAIRWTMLHRRSSHKKFSQYRAKQMLPTNRTLQLLLNTADLEFRLKKMFHNLLDTKEQRWEDTKNKVSGMMKQLSAVFSGQQALTMVEANEQAQQWFSWLGEQVASLDYHDATVAGRKIQQLMESLTKVEQFEMIDTNSSIKHFLGEARESLDNMVRTVNVRDSIVVTIDTISDMSYAWEVIHDYVRDMQTRVRRDPSSVTLLRAVFLKLSSVLDVPLVRITQASSPDAVSVAQYYSAELVSLVRHILQVVPATVFEILHGMIALQTSKMKPLPIKLELANLKDLAQLTQRHELARTTHQISVFTEGILAMKATLLGIIKVDPRAILQDGIRKELVRQISAALNRNLVFDYKVGRGRHPISSVLNSLGELAKQLDGFQRSFEYIQDYINTYGLKVWQEEFTRVINLNVDIECGRYHRPGQESQYQSKDIPIPLYKPIDKHRTFMGRLVHALLFLTDSRTTVYSVESAAWFDAHGREAVGLKLMDVLKQSMGVPGLVGMDRILSFRIQRDLRRSFNMFRHECNAGAKKMLSKLSMSLRPHARLAPNTKVHGQVAGRISKPLAAFQGMVLRIGQAQMLRRQIAQQLQFSSRLDSKLLFCSLQAFNDSILNDVRRHYQTPEAPYPESNNPLFPELAKYLTSSGLHDSLSQLFVTTEPLPFISLWMTLLVVSAMPRLAYDRAFGTLVRSRSSEALDGTPLVYGICTLLKQLHPTVTRQFLAYLGQYVRTAVFHCFGRERPVSLPVQVVNTLLFVRHFCDAAHVPQRVLDPYIPSYVMDAVSISS